MTSSESKKKVLRVGILSRVGTLNPRKTIDAVSSVVLGEVYERPYSLPIGTDAPKPCLFSEPIQPDGKAGEAKSWSAPFKSGSVFSDGTAMTAQHVAQSLAGSQNFSRQATVEVRGDRLRFQLSKPNPRFDLVLTANYAGIVLEKGSALFGSGPFMFPPGTMQALLPRIDRLTLVRNPHYPSPIDLDEIAFITYPPSAGGGTELLLEAAKRGEIDFTYSLTSVDAAALRGLPFVPAISAANSTALLQMNTTRPSLAGSTVRRAISLAIDRRTIAESMYERNPLAYVASSLLPSMMGRDQNTFTFDLGKAKQLAESAGSRMPKQLSLLLLWSPRPYMPNPLRAGELLRDQLAAIGVTVNLIVPKDRTDYFDQVGRGNYELLLGGWIADTVDPADFLESTLASRSIPDPTRDAPTSNNASRWTNAAMDAALDRFRTEPTDAHRAEVMKILIEEAPLVPLIYGQAVAIYSTNVMGFRASALGRCALSSLQLRVST